jgi:hypothetical protein
MAKKRGKVSRKVARPVRVSAEDKLFNFVLGVMYFFVLEMVFMLGGMYLQNVIGLVGSTGIPSVLGLVVWAILSTGYKEKREMFLGGLAISVLVPIILIIVTMTRFVNFMPIMYYSIAAFIIVELWMAFKLMKKK